MASECTMCGVKLDFDAKDYFIIYQADYDIDEYLCSPSCLVEFAWKLKESQPKLSKSKMEVLEDV